MTVILGHNYLIKKCTIIVILKEKTTKIFAFKIFEINNKEDKTKKNRQVEVQQIVQTA